VERATQTVTKVRQITEERRGDVPLFVQPEWAVELPWLVQGTTDRDAGNYSSFGVQTAGVVHTQWQRLRMWTGMRTSVLGRQVHATEVLEHGALSAGLMLADDSDGHITDAAGVLLAVSVADCVPVFVVDAQQRRVAVLHAGWRGAADGIIRNCVEVMGSGVRVHLGPAICGNCYEVGPEVHVALGLKAPDRNTPVDLRAVLAAQCMALGIAAGSITTSSWCTRCQDSPFFSHRAGHPERQVGIIGLR
jgi:polyphenol oxidase